VFDDLSTSFSGERKAGSDGKCCFSHLCSVHKRAPIFTDGDSMPFVAVAASRTVLALVQRSITFADSNIVVVLGLLFSLLSLPATLLPRQVREMSPNERSPLLPTSTPSGRPSSLSLVTPTSSSSTSSNGALNTSAGLILTEDDITIEGMVLALLAELAARGYTLPPGLPTLPSDMPVEEAEAESAFLRTVFGLKRHRDVLDDWVPNLNRQEGTAAGAGAAGSILATNRPITPSPLASTSSLTSTTSTLPSRPSPLSSQSLDPTVLTSPSALFLASLLSLLISLQTEYRGTVQETDRGVDGELRMFKARRELGERLYAVVVGLLDSYLLSGDSRGSEDEDDEEEEKEDALVTLLFRDFPLNYDSMDRATCCACLFSFSFFCSLMLTFPSYSRRPPTPPLLFPHRRSRRPRIASRRSRLD
jgi:hypothetical protein